MKIAPLLVASATALETSSTANHLLAAVGQRNVSHMEALVQGLADESVQVPAWKFDEDIRSALDAIRNIFVGNIQKALNEQHKVDQEHLNCETETCFMGCINDYKKANDDCADMDKECKHYEDAHYKCRTEVYKSYVFMAQSCASLHCFIHDWKDDPCPTEECLCPDLTVCHMSSGGYDEQCIARIGECKATYGAWLLKMIGKFESGYKTFLHLHTECKTSYHAFLHVDMDCDTKQKEFESCHCKQNSCQDRACTVKFEQCQIGCWDRYEVVIKEKECLEKDRKIDWSATKKIECYIDILLHDYTKEELLTKCGTETCVNVAREEDYKHCHTICLEVDHEGEWPKVHSVSLACDKANEANYCVQITTDSGSFAVGSLTVHVETNNGLVQEASGTFPVNSVVLQKCYTSPILSMEVMGPTTNAWIGSIRYSSDGGATYDAMSCTDCTNGDSSGFMIVDGNADGTLMDGRSMCNNGDTCHLAPLMTVFHTALPPQATQYASQTAYIEGHHARSKHDQYHLGDGSYKCDANGAEVMTRHRGGGKDRVGEARCTEHLDIDYQIPPCCDCVPERAPVCDEDWHCKYYSGFDDITLISEISDCCPEDCGETCFPDAPLKIIGMVPGYEKTCAKDFSMVSIPEHSHAWAYNRCPCTDCTNAIPGYPLRHQQCGQGPHTILKKVGY